MSDLTFLDHIIYQTRQNVELLISHNKISQSDGRDILEKLSTAGTGSIASLTQQTERLAMSPVMMSNSANSHVSHRGEARAIWEWTSEDPNDLSFHAGEIIEIVKETNVDWWIGRNKAGKEGLFPSAYVEKTAPRSVSPLSFPKLPNTNPSLDGKCNYSQGPPLQYSTTQAVLPQYPPPPGHSPAGGYTAPSGHYGNSPPVVQPTPQSQLAQRKARFGDLGTTVAQSAAGGIGFGAGVAIGSDVINSIF